MARWQAVGIAKGNADHWTVSEQFNDEKAAVMYH